MNPQRGYNYTCAVDVLILQKRPIRSYDLINKKLKEKQNYDDPRPLDPNNDVDIKANKTRKNDKSKTDDKNVQNLGISSCSLSACCLGISRWWDTNSKDCCAVTRNCGQIFNQCCGGDIFRSMFQIILNFCGDILIFLESEICQIITNVLTCVLNCFCC